MEESSKLAMIVREQLEKEYKELAGALDPDMYRFLVGCDNSFYGIGSRIDYDNKYCKKIYQMFSEGKKPSDFFKTKEKEMKVYFSPAFLPFFYYAIDHVRDWQLSDSAYRRSYRSSNYWLYMKKIMQISRYFRDLTLCGADMYSLLAEKADEKLIAYMNRGNILVSDAYIAAALDLGDGKLESLLEDIIMGDGGRVSVPVIRGIVMSHNSKMHELLGKLLLAARLQEGLRQAICENMDRGTREGFLYLLGVIAENGLMRYSSVKRAVATCTGLLTAEEKNEDRITEKQIGLIMDYLRDPGLREKAFEGEDSMEIYLALWGYAFGDIDVAMERAIRLMNENSHHTRLVAAYFLTHADIPYSVNKATIEVFRQYNREMDTVALIMNQFMNGVHSEIFHVLSPAYGEKEDKPDEQVFMDYQIYFESPEQTREIYDLLKALLERMGGKKVTFSSLVFPWNDVSFTSTDVIERMGFCASALKDEKLILEVAEKLSDMPSPYGERGRLVNLLLDDPGTPQMLQLLTKCVCDNEAFTRNVAAKLLARVAQKDTTHLDPVMAAPEGELPDMCYDMLEEMLRFKKADLRTQVLSLLQTMPDKRMLVVIERLLADKSEEKRTAGLDMVLQLKKKNSPCLQSALNAVESMETCSTRETILIKEILGEENEKKGKEAGYGIYDVNATYEPELESPYLEHCKELFSRTFHASVNDACELRILKELDDLIEQNKELEYRSVTGTELLGDDIGTVNVNGERKLPYAELWEEFYQNHIRTMEELLRLKVLLTNMVIRDDRVSGMCAHFKPILKEIFGADMWLDDLGNLSRIRHYNVIIGELAREKIPAKTLADHGIYLAYYLASCKKDLNYHYTVNELKNEWERRGTDPKKTFEISVVFCGAVGYLLKYMKDSKEGFPYFYNLAWHNQFHFDGALKMIYTNGNPEYYPQPVDYVSACANGFISKDFLLKELMDDRMLEETLSSLSDVVIYVRETGKAMASKGYVYSWKIRQQKQNVRRLLGKELPEKATDMIYDEQDQKYIDLALECFDKISQVILNVELVRGDTDTEFSYKVRYLKRLYGVEYLVRILAALGKETLDRSSYWDKPVSKRRSLSHLLECCMPDYREGDKKQQAEKLSALIKGTDIKESRLIEACLFTPEWIDIVGEYLGWEGFTSGCYYFIAHMNEHFSEDKMAIIARYTPLSEEELNNGAFDKNWFDEVYERLGKKRFDMIYSAAKYISDGSRHTRARKYADAARGEMDASRIREEIAAKRNKDLLMAYGLIPGTDREICERYEYVQQFAKESRQFGAQRRASEKLAVEMAVKNMATEAGYSDETGFILKMEALVSDGRKECWEPREVGDYQIWLDIDEDGKIDLKIRKGEKMLSSVPAAIKKEEYVVSLQDTRKALTEQYRRTRKMLEEAMETETAFTPEDVLGMKKNPVSAGLVDRLIFKAGDLFGFPEELQQKGIPEGTKLVIAHPFHLFRAGVWRDYQQMIFEKQIRQPFKQVFRELYVKTEEEKGLIHSMRYAGNQIQPGKTKALLGSRRWLTDEENGLQKIFYKSNIIAEIYALADWFSPSDIEEPTLEWVCFANRKGFQPMLVDEVPDVIFSEVMRDVDLAVSVAHAGGVDPEMSHSTVEMRKAIAEFTVASFGLGNVNFTSSHAIVKGTRGTYSIHLGSGVIHQEGGPMINVLPVHSQRRGRLFLPFVDDDPKTAEVLSKILLFAEDKKIKDPFILEQIV